MSSNKDKPGHSGTSKSGSMAEKSVKDIDLPFKKNIEEIYNHEIKKTGVRFQVKWKGYYILTWERSEFIVKKRGKGKLMDYLADLQLDKPARFTNIMNKQPDLSDILKENRGRK